jgi:CheY-like chemotaxis protein
LVATILIVEDNVFIREVAEMIIQDLGHQTFSASDEDEAMALLRSPEHFDALFTDIYLKDTVLGGCAVASEARLLRPDLRVLYTTGNSVTEKMKALFTAGSQFLLKPYSPRQLQDSVEHLLAA